MSESNPNRFLVRFQAVKNLSRDGRADEIANEIVFTFDLILIRFGRLMTAKFSDSERNLAY